MTGRLSRALKIVLACIAVALFALGLTILASAALDRPSKTIQSEVTIDAPVETIWGILTDFEDYKRWNPLQTDARGKAGLGETIEVAIAASDGDAEVYSSEITILRPNRKIAWISHKLMPGISDREYEVILTRLDEERARVDIHQRFEGVLIPFTSTTEEEGRLDLMAAALKERAEMTSPVGG